MKLERLTSTTHSISRDAAERARAAAGEERRVNAAEGTDDDRERSLQQEIAAAAAVIASADTGEGVLQEAKAVAGELVRLGDEAGHLLKPMAPPGHSPTVDTEA